MPSTYGSIDLLRGLRKRKSSSKALSQEPVKSSVLTGVVVRADPGNYGCVVRYDDKEYYCSVLVQESSITNGYSICSIPKEGEEVAFVVRSSSAASAAYAQTGFILGIIPGTVNNNIRDTYYPDLDMHTYTIKAYRDIVTGSPIDALSIQANARRPVDVIPGEYAVLNENGCGVYGDLFSMSLLGGLGAQVRADAIDDTVRIISRTRQEFTSLGHSYTYEDGGFSTEESAFSVCSKERRGLHYTSETDDPFVTVEPEEGVIGQNTKQNTVSKQTARSRFRSFKGFLGNLISIFLSKPDKEITEPLSMDHNPKESGVTHLNVDDNGKVHLVSAGGIHLERYDRIPVPVRKTYPWDPSGDNTDSDDLFTIIDGYCLDDSSDVESERQYLAPMVLSDRIAWDLNNSYRRFIEHKKDFYVPSEKEINTPEFDQSLVDSTSVSFLKNKGKRCGIHFGEDGSVIIRDAWGSEIVMIGGNITISCPGNVNILPGRNSNTIAGYDIVEKAYNGIDVSATNHDVRVKSEHHIEMVAGSDRTTDRCGILLESKSINCNNESLSDSDYDSFSDSEIATGQDQILNGILIRSPGSVVGIDASMVNTRARRNMFFTTGNSKSDIDQMALEDAHLAMEDYEDSDLESSDFDKRIDAENKFYEKLEEKKQEAIQRYKEQLDSSSDLFSLGLTGSITTATKDYLCLTSEASTFSVSSPKDSSDSELAPVNVLKITSGKGFFSYTSNRFSVFTRDGVVFTKEKDVGFDAIYAPSSAISYASYEQSALEKDAKNREIIENVKQFTFPSDEYFTFRTSKQCMTTVGSELRKAPASFTLYQPNWSIQQSVALNKTPVPKSIWIEKRVGSEYPWPGTVAYNSGKYMTTTSSNVGLDGISEAPENLSKTPSIEENSLFKYEIPSTDPVSFEAMKNPLDKIDHELSDLEDQNKKSARLPEGADSPVIEY